MVIDKKIYDKVVDITYTGYKPLIENENGVLLSENSVMAMFEEMISQVDYLQEQYDDLEQDLHDNYRPLPMSEYTGDSYDDRF